jgi:hypothetical protein
MHFREGEAGPQVVRESLAHLRRYLELLFTPPGNRPFHEEESA